MRRTIIILILAAIGFSCTKDAIHFPTTNCSWRELSENHPKNDLYQEVLDQYTELGIPGIVVLIAKKRENIWAGASGVAEIENGLPLEPCHIMPLGGVGELFCGTAAMLMTEDEILDLDVKIADYLPVDISGQIPNSQNITIAHLLSHKSGIPDYSDNPNAMLDLLNNKDMDFSRENILERYVYGRSSKFSPGEKYSYSHSNYEILTLIMDQVYPKGHADYYSFRLFRRLGLEKTYYKGETDYYSLNSRGMANGYFDRYSKGELENATDLSLTIVAGQTGSDGVVSSVVDLYTFLKSIMTADIVRPTSLEIMKTYGIATGHSGSSPGYSTEAWYYPEEDSYIIYLINAGNTINGPIQRLIDIDFHEKILSTVFTN